jgi:hypothetical protein
VTDAVDGFEAVTDADSVKSPPALAHLDSGVDLEVEVSMGVAGARGVVAYYCGLDLVDRHLDLAAPRTDAYRDVIGEPGDDLFGRALLGCVVGRGDLGMDGGSQ